MYRTPSSFHLPSLSLHDRAQVVQERVVRTKLETALFSDGNGGVDYAKDVSTKLLSKHAEELGKLTVEADGNGYDLMYAAAAYGAAHRGADGKARAVVEVLRDAGDDGVGVANRFVSWWMANSINTVVSALKRHDADEDQVRTMYNRRPYHEGGFDEEDGHEFDEEYGYKEDREALEDSSSLAPAPKSKNKEEDKKFFYLNTFSLRQVQTRTGLSQIRPNEPGYLC